ncbi:hypothetical protein FKM82_028787, partial [Ascaphus truei]
ASLAVWKIILRFMGEIPEPALYAPSFSSQSSSVITQIYDTLSRKNNLRPGIRGDPQGSQRANMKGKNSREISSMKLTRSSKLAGQ